MLTALQTGERRQSQRSHNSHWELMSAEQKITLYDLHKFGYQLLFVRQLSSSPLAFITQNESLAVIEANGEVDYSPKVQIRQSNKH
ncbi:hypothetical protein [Shewanella pneumatophori]|uniref:Uncharacterized protein n=1 Tax=Shewanella pneumatophori TaxID=314092 RepID=A0A9X1ZDH3_9GAMM|nr:hypothetical protein [Shewanella pneumatophori]MCL1140249.1 hypothetical protein [Shewanella pneumatophori]